MSQSASTFEVASVKPTRAVSREQYRLECSAGGRFVSRGTPLLWAIKWAYGLADYQVKSGWPDWLNAFGTYDIEAKAEGPASEDACRAMVRSLFEERFRLRSHRETARVSAYALVVAKGGPRLHGAGRVTINGEVKQAVSESEPPDWTIARLANYLAGVRGVDRPVLDRTGLGGAYGFTLEYARRDGEDRPDVFTAVRESLGLKLEAVKAAVEMFVIDGVERPGGN